MSRRSPYRGLWSRRGVGRANRRANRTLWDRTWRLKSPRQNASKRRRA